MPAVAKLRDVAEKAGVSIGTASQALNNRPNVAPETRARVIEAAVSLSYSVKENTADPCEQPLKVVGMLTKHDFGLPITVNPFYSHVQAGVESECRRRQISLMFANIEVDQSNRPIAWPPMVSEQRVDGLVLMGTFIEESIDLLQRHMAIPIILIDSYAPNMTADSVWIDNYGGATQAMRYLLANGHTQIGLIGTNEVSPPGVMERRKAYFQVMQDAGKVENLCEDCSLDRQSAYDATQRLLRRAPQTTAIFSANDDTALGVMNGARDLGYILPKDLSVIGFDDIDLAKDVVPALTTIHVHKTWMGVLGVRSLIEKASNPEQPKITIVISTQLITRDSVSLPGGARQETPASEGAMMQAPR